MELDQANDEALQQAIRASLLHSDDGLTAAQIFARDTGDPVQIQEANDQALAQGIDASLETASTPKKARRARVPDHEIVMQRTLNEKLRHVLETKGYDIHPNRGNQNNCLIISILQHVTGNYHSDHTDQAKHYKKLLVERSGGTEKTGNALFSDDKLTRWLIAKINHDYFGKAQDKYVKFKFITANLNGEPGVRTIGEGARVGGIVDLAGHYVAYTARA